MSDRVLDDREVGPPPLRRAVLGVLLGAVAGIVSAVLLPREDAPEEAPPR